MVRPATPKWFETIAQPAPLALSFKRPITPQRRARGGHIRLNHASRETLVTPVATSSLAQAGPTCTSMACLRTTAPARRHHLRRLQRATTRCNKPAASRAAPATSLDTLMRHRRRGRRCRSRTSATCIRRHHTLACASATRTRTHHTASGHTLPACAVHLHQALRRDFLSVLCTPRQYHRRGDRRRADQLGVRLPRANRPHKPDLGGLPRQEPAT